MVEEIKAMQANPVLRLEYFKKIRELMALRRAQIHKGKDQEEKMKGYTLSELMIVITGIFVLCLGGALVYAAFHFISKWW